MGGKGRRRREARRRARQRQREQRLERPLEEEGVAAGVAEEPAEERVQAAALEAGHGRAARKRAKRKGGPWQRLRRLRLSPWLLALPVLAVGIAFVVVGVMRGGSSGTPRPTPTPDPRVAGLPIDASFTIEAGDDGVDPATSSFFEPNVITAKAGDVIEIEVRNTGSVSHNLWVAGPDNEYDTEDDFGPSPLITPGETGRLVVKIDEPGTYLFRCQIHPNVQVGTLVLQ